MPKALCTLVSLLLLTTACEAPRAQDASEGAAASDGPRPEWALAIHGGAGVISKSMPEEEQQEYFDTLREALTLGRDLLEGGASSLDAVEKTINRMEDSPLFNAGKGAVFTHEGGHELDGAIMDGRTLDCGSVSGLTTVKNPISLARLVLEESRHVFLVGEGAERFATEVGVERVEQEYYFVQRRYEQWQRALERERDSGGHVQGKFSTVGAVALDRDGDLAAGTSSGGLTNKRFGRVGDVPIVGAGTYANNRTAAISGTGIGEQFIRHTVAHDVSALMEYRGLSLEAAAEEVVFGKLEPGDGGVIGVAHDGSIALVFNSRGMFRGAADAKGRFEVKIWE